MSTNANVLERYLNNNHINKPAQIITKPPLNTSNKPVLKPATATASTISAKSKETATNQKDQAKKVSKVPVKQANSGIKNKENSLKSPVKLNNAKELDNSKGDEENDENFIHLNE